MLLKLLKSKITVNGTTYQYKVKISTYYRKWQGNDDPALVTCLPCHEHYARVEISDEKGEQLYAFNCRVFFYLDKNGKPNHRSYRYTYAGIVEARLQRFIKKLLF